MRLVLWALGTKLTVHPFEEAVILVQTAKTLFCFITRKPFNRGGRKETRFQDAQT